MSGVVIVGAAMTRFGKFPDRDLASLAEEAVGAALADAGVKANEVDIVFFANASAGIVTGQEMIRGQVSLQGSGLLGKPIVNVENACASASSAVHLARLAVLSGEVDGGSRGRGRKLAHPEKQRHSWRWLPGRMSLGPRSSGVSLHRRTGSGCRSSWTCTRISRAGT